MSADDPQTLDRLIHAALSVRDRAYARYSQFQVGAALMTDDGEIIVGCNIENASYSLTLCAERVAAAAAVARGYRSWRTMVIASIGGVMPCGACRQFLAEFGNQTEILCVDVADGSRHVRQLVELLPDAFRSSDLPRVG